MSKSTAKVKRKLIHDLDTNVSQNKRVKGAVKNSNKNERRLHDMADEVEEMQGNNPAQFEGKKTAKITNNNRTVKVQLKINKQPISKEAKIKQNKSRSKTPIRSNKWKKSVLKKVTPIIQTRAMKLKLANDGKDDQVNKELEDLNTIDALTSNEIVDGDRVFDDSNGKMQEDDNNDQQINHDGVELSISGSDIEEFGGDSERLPTTPSHHSNDSESENGEVFSEDESDVERDGHQVSVASKIVKVSKDTPRSRFDKFSHLREDPEFRDFVKELIHDEHSGNKKNKDSHCRKNKSSRSRSRSRSRSNNNRRHDRDHHHCHRSSSSRRSLSKDKDKHRRSGKGDCDCERNTSDYEMNSSNVEIRQRRQRQVPLIKSPSDSTLYSPALKQMSNEEVTLIDKISNFVESIRLDCKSSDWNGNNTGRNDRLKQTSVDEVRRQGSRDVRQDNYSNYSTPVQQTSRRVVHRESSTSPSVVPKHSKMTDQALLQTEKFKARVEAPKGNYSFNDIMPYDYEKLRSKFVTENGLAPIDREIMFLRNFDQDDEFFHIMSQIDPSLRIKIEHGEYIELERLLPHDRTSRSGGPDDLNRQLFQLITQGTNSYLEAPAPRTGKINSVRKWDQAFRVFAAIYTHANPERASEIWQYVYVIHTAAAANPWDNVYYYDVNFRELMASKPWRSWAKTYTQGWNMAFNNATVNAYSTVGNNIPGSSNHRSQNQNHKGWKDQCCWRYNKNKCNKSGSDCNYDHRCTYCAGWNHSFTNCKKRQNKQKKTTGGSSDKSTPKGDN